MAAFILLLLLPTLSDSARILGVFPAPVFSHQLVFRALTNELANQGHELTVITSYPQYTDKTPPKNYKEINIQEGIQAAAAQCLKEDLKGADDIYTQQGAAFKAILAIFDRLLAHELKDFVRSDQKFDVILAEACVRQNLIFSHIFDAPIIQVSSFGPVFDTFEMVGGPNHPLLYPLAIRENYKNLSMLDKVSEVYRHEVIVKMFYDTEGPEQKLVWKYLGGDFPPFAELKQNVAMVFVNVHSVWDSNRPVPPNVIYLGGLHLQKRKELPKDLQAQLDAASSGAIYMSFGSTISSTIFNSNKLNIFLSALSELPYKIFWKWDADLENVPNNVVIGKWFPQADLLKHPNVKLFISQGGLQSTDEAIDAEVPMLGVPILWDQFFNVDKIVEFGAGVRCDIADVTKDSFKNAVQTVILDKRYKENIKKLKRIMRDEPQTSLEKAVWWTEYVIRHKGAKHLRSPAFEMSATDYYEIQLVLSAVISLIVCATVIVLSCLKFVAMFKSKVKSD